MQSREIVKRAIEFRKPPRLPFCQHDLDDLPDDVCECWELDRQKSGWFFGEAPTDDWGCGWKVLGKGDYGQVVEHPIEDWGKLDAYRPPNPRDPFYFERIEADLADAGDRYVMVTSHFNLIERLHFLHGFSRTLEDFYLAPEKVEKVLDMILEFKLELFDELHRRFGDRIDGLWLTDDWGTQEGPLISGRMFEDFFLERYRTLVGAVHNHGWHYMQHSCGKINDLVPYFIDVGVDVMNMMQPQTYGIEEIGERFAGKICFLTTADYQKTLPEGDPAKIRAEVEQLVRCWSTSDGGMVVFNIGDPGKMAITYEAMEAMFRAFAAMSHYRQ